MLDKAAAMLGYGGALLRAAGVRRPLPRRAFDAFWLGQAALLALVLWANLVAPLSLGVSLALLAPGWLLAAASLIRGRTDLRRYAGRLIRVRPRLTLTLAALTLWLLNQAIGPAGMPDTKMYHLVAVRWANLYPVVPGLTNLQHNQGYNNSTHLLAALIDHRLFDLRSPHVLISLLWLPLALRCAWGWRQVLRRGGRAGRRLDLEDLWYALLLLPWLTRGVILSGYPPNPGHHTRFVTRHGLELTVPADRSLGLWLWDAPLPSTHVPNPDLRLRDPHRLGSGFIIDPGPPTPRP